MLYVIGLGLGDAKDITVKGLEIVKRCDLVYLESYTSILTCGKEQLVNKKKQTDRNLCDNKSIIVLGKVL
jgi:diphthine synthase